MVQVSCPSCKRKGTYAEKFKQCSGCGRGYELPKVVAESGEEPKVVKSDPVPAESGKTTFMRRKYDPLLVVGEPCPTCGKKVGRRAYRERKEG